MTVSMGDRLGRSYDQVNLCLPVWWGHALQKSAPPSCSKAVSRGGARANAEEAIVPI
jgi:hypothetical protein